jgi:acyl dehydratase
MMGLKIDRAIVGTEFDRTVCPPVTEAEIREYSTVSGEPLADDEAGALIAPPTFVVRMRGQRFMPPSLPEAVRMGFDAGKDIEFGVPVCVGDLLTVVSTVHDLYEKTGRSGPMAFLVLRSVVTNQRGERVAVIDQKMMFR